MPDPLDVPAGWLTFRYAAIAEKFCILPAQLAGMTDYQLDAICTHPRTKDGALVPPKGAEPDAPPPEPTLTERLTLIDKLEHDRIVTPQKAVELREQVRNGDQRGR